MEQFDEPLTIEEKRARTNEFPVTSGTIMGGRMTYAEWMARGNEISARARQAVEGINRYGLGSQAPVYEGLADAEAVNVPQESVGAVGQLANSRVLETTSI